MIGADTVKSNEIVFKYDIGLLAAVLALTGIGLVMVLSAGGVVAEKFFDNKYHFFRNQLIFAVIGIGAMLIAARVPRAYIYKFRYIWLLIVLVLLVMTLATPLGIEVNGARRWLRVGFVGLQPMELAKPALVIYLAWFFSMKQDLIKSFSVGVVPPYAVTGILCLLILLQPDFGGAAFLVFLLFLMSLVGGTRLVYLAASMFLAVMAGLLLIVQSPYRSKRLLAFLDPFKDALDSGYQLVQSLYALGSGRIWGVGLGAGKQKLFFLPEAHNDFIMAVIGEELGFLGVSVVFVIMGYMVWRAFTVALSAQDLIDRFTAFGMSAVIGLGAILNMAVVLGTAPPKGVPMPFISYGGSSLITSFICVGILLNISATNKQHGYTTGP